MLVTGLLLQRSESGFTLEDVSLLPVFPAFAVTGAILWLHPSSARIGRQLLGVAVCASCFLFASSYAGYATGHGTVGATVASWIAAVLFFPQLVMFVRVLLLFPTGDVPSSRWRIVSRATWIVAAIGVLVGALRGELDFVQPPLDNPVAFDAADPILDALAPSLFPGVALLGVLAVASLLSRFRSALSAERQQIKWVAYAASVFMSIVVLDEIVLDAVGVEHFGLDQVLGVVSNLVGALGIPIAVVIAVLRYRLYDIDVVINRTLVYGVLSAVLGAIYVGFVFGFQALLAPFTADSDLAIAGSTLAVAALFRPARSRVQSFIDRRFYRRKVDAQRTLEVFSAGLRDEVDLSALASRLTAVVGSTMQPAHVSLWLRRSAP